MHKHGNIREQPEAMVPEEPLPGQSAGQSANSLVRAMNEMSLIESPLIVPKGYTTFCFNTKYKGVLGKNLMVKEGEYEIGDYVVVVSE